jgi:hypothetical protein
LVIRGRGSAEKSRRARQITPRQPTDHFNVFFSDFRVATVTPPQFHESATFYSPLKKNEKPTVGIFRRGLPATFFGCWGLQNNRQCMQWALEVLFSTAHTIQTRGCSHFTTVSVTRHMEFFSSHCPFSPKFLHSECALAVGRGLRTKQPTGTRDSVHTARDLREVRFCRYQRRVPFMAMFFQRLWQLLLFLWQTFRFAQAHQHGTIAQSARTEVLGVCGQPHLHLLFVSLFWSALLSHCVVSDAPHFNVPLTDHLLLTLFFAAHVCAL